MDVNVLNEAIETYGTDNQKVKCMEELSELSKEICKDIECIGDENHIAEEIADSLIMIEQMILIYKNRDLVDKFIESKIERLKSRLRNFN